MLIDEEPSKQAPPFPPPHQAWPANEQSAPPAYDEVLNQTGPTDSVASSSSRTRDAKTPLAPREDSVHQAPPVRMESGGKRDRAPPNASYQSYAPPPTTYPASPSPPVASGSSTPNGALNLLNTVLNGVIAHTADKHARRQSRRAEKWDRRAQRWSGLKDAVGGSQGGQGAMAPGGYDRGMGYGGYGRGMAPAPPAGQWAGPPPPPPAGQRAPPPPLSDMGVTYGQQTPADPRVPVPYDYPQRQQPYTGKGAPPM